MEPINFEPRTRALRLMVPQMSFQQRLIVEEKANDEAGTYVRLSRKNPKNIVIHNDLGDIVSELEVAEDGRMLRELVLMPNGDLEEIEFDEMEQLVDRF